MFSPVPHIPPAYDCIIIGAGAAGLCAATYLARFRRNALVIDGGDSRLDLIPCSRNVPGFPDGIEGRVLRGRLMTQAQRYGVTVVKARVDAVRREQGRLQVQAGDIRLAAQTILIATGAKLVEPAIAGLDAGVARGVIRYCPVCDGYETNGLNVAVLGRTAAALGEARFLKGYAAQVSFLMETRAARPYPRDAAEAESMGVTLVGAPVRGIELLDARVRVWLEDGAAMDFDCLYPALGCDPRSELLAGLGCELSPSGGALVDPHQRTSVEGVYAAGDVLEGLDQIASAWGQAAIGAAAIHNDLRAEGDLPPEPPEAKP